MAQMIHWWLWTLFIYNTCGIRIAEGNFIVEPLTGGCDNLGNLGDITCNFWGALK